MASASANPVLNDQAFERGSAELGVTTPERMSVRSTYLKTGFLLILLILAAAFGWSQVRIVEVSGSQVPLAPSWTWGVVLLTFILGIAGAFAVRAAAIISILYAIFEGMLLGIVSAFYNLEFQGVVLQAVLVTVCIFAVMLVLYTLGIIKVTAGFAVGIAAAMGGLALLYLIAWLLSLFGVNLAFLYSPTPVGIGLALLIVLLAALNLPLSFAFIERAAEAGAPKQLEWYGAFGLMLSLIWMYVSILRLLALLRASQ
jgi:uncharacterized YccA/Bax inhibitor family protein